MLEFKALIETDFEKALCKLCRASAEMDVLKTMQDLGYEISKKDLYEVVRKLQEAEAEYRLHRPEVADEKFDGKEMDFFQDCSYLGFEYKGGRLSGDFKNLEGIAENLYKRPTSLQKHEMGVLLFFHYYELTKFYKWHNMEKRLKKSILHKLIAKIRTRFSKKAIYRKAGE